MHFHPDEAEFIYYTLKRVLLQYENVKSFFLPLSTKGEEAVFKVSCPTVSKVKALRSQNQFPQNIAIH